MAEVVDEDHAFARLGVLQRDPARRARLGLRNDTERVVPGKGGVVRSVEVGERLRIEPRDQVSHSRLLVDGGVSRHLGRASRPAACGQSARPIGARAMRYFVALILALLAPFAVPPALAEPADIAAASRGVVRVVLVANDGQTIQYVGHGSGFAVSPTLVVTNAHVIAAARDSDEMMIGVVPSEGTSGYLAKVVAYSPRNDLALLRLIDKGAIPALTLFPGAVEDGGEVYAVGYPGNVDLAQGLSLAEIVEPQSAVKTRGYL